MSLHATHCAVEKDPVTGYAIAVFMGNVLSEDAVTFSAQQSIQKQA